MGRLLSLLDWLALGLLRGLTATLSRLPADVVIRLGEWFGGLGYWLQPKRARIGVRNVRAAFDGQLSTAQARRLIRTVYCRFGAGMFELFRLPAMTPEYFERYLSFEGDGPVRQALASRQPIIFLTGHYGNWELSSIGAALLGHPIVALARVQDRFPRLYRQIVAYRESRGCRIVHKGRAMRALLEALHAGRPVGIVGDQVSRQGIFVEFFGRPALFAKGPFEIAYRKHAVVIPVFMHRVRGPTHRLEFEPIMRLDRSRPEAEVVAEGVRAFAAALAKHVRNDPSQWLWTHKRWKHTPARRILILSDGKLGHVKQSRLVADALAARRDGVTVQEIEIRWRHPIARILAALWAAWAPGALGAAACLRWALDFDGADRLTRRYADLIISCGAATAPANRLWAAENDAKSVIIMNPAPLPLWRFDLVIAPKHDGLRPRANLVETVGAVSAAPSEEALRAAAKRLHAHPRFIAEPLAPAQTPAHPRAQTAVAGTHPTIAVLLGGDTDEYTQDAAFVDALIVQVLAACEATDGRCLVTTSRRTAPDAERVLEERLAQQPRCRLLLLASRDPLDGTMEGLLGAASVTVVTGESISMVSEASASGRPVIVVEPPLRRANQHGPTKHQRFLQDLAGLGHVRLSPLPELGAAIQDTLANPRPIRPLQTAQRVIDAVERLL